MKESFIATQGADPPPKKPPFWGQVFFHAWKSRDERRDIPLAAISHHWIPLNPMHWSLRSLTLPTRQSELRKAFWIRCEMSSIIIIIRY